MDLLNMLLNQGGGQAVRQLAQNFGLDSNRDGSVADDLLGMAAKFFRK